MTQRMALPGSPMEHAPIELKNQPRYGHLQRPDGILGLNHVQFGLFESQLGHQKGVILPRLFGWGLRPAAQRIF
jgi:hypothetical protein